METLHPGSAGRYDILPQQRGAGGIARGDLGRVRCRRSPGSRGNPCLLILSPALVCDCTIILLELLLDICMIIFGYIGNHGSVEVAVPRVGGDGGGRGREGKGGELTKRAEARAYFFFMPSVTQAYRSRCGLLLVRKVGYFGWQLSDARVVRGMGEIA